MCGVRTDTTKRLISYLKCRSVEVINNPAIPGSNHKEVNYIIIIIIMIIIRTTTTMMMMMMVIVVRCELRDVVWRRRRLFVVPPV